MKKTLLRKLLNNSFMKFSVNMCQVKLEFSELLPYNKGVSSSASFCEEGSQSEPL